MIKKEAQGIELSESIVSGLVPAALNLMSGGAIDTASAITQAASDMQIEITPDQQTAVEEAIAEKQKETAETAATETSIAASSIYNRLTQGSRELLYNLDNRYTRADLELNQALCIWKDANLNPQMIRDQIRNDVGYNITLGEAKILHRLGSDMKEGRIDLGIDQNEDVLYKMSVSQSVKLTPSVKASVERVGKNLFRTKRANILWKIDVKNTDDGNEIPYLVRVDTVLAQEEKLKK